MNIPISKVKKEAGFRINLVDILFIGLLIFSSYYLYNLLGSMENLYILPLYVGFTFFLFCNVFRLRTKDEFLWTLFFLLVSTITFNFFRENWVFTSMALSSFFQFIEIVITVRSKGYKGVFSG